MSQTQFRYSQNSFQTSVLVALGLTAIVSFLVWLFSRLLGFVHYNWITAVSGLIFFSFCSAAMIIRYMRNEVVLSVRPDGLFDARYSSQAVPWEEIKDIRLGRHENEFQLNVFLWPREAMPGQVAQPSFTIDLAPLDGGVEAILAAVGGHVTISMDQG